jgi:hypothetical protein
MFLSRASSVGISEALVGGTFTHDVTIFLINRAISLEVCSPSIKIVRIRHQADQRMINEFTTVSGI